MICCEYSEYCINDEILVPLVGSFGSFPGITCNIFIPNDISGIGKTSHVSQELHSSASKQKGAQREYTNFP
jgi:hypothetical protein